jgi:hypothetical protein
LLLLLVQLFTVRVQVTGVVVLTVIGLVVAPLLQVSSEALIILLLPSFAVMTVVPSQLSTFDKTGAAGVFFGEGLMELLLPLVQPLTVLVAVTAAVVFTVIGLPVAPLLHVNSEELMLLLLPSFAVIVVVPLQLSTFERTGAAGVVFGAGVMELLALLLQPLTVRVAVTALVLFTEMALPVAPLLHVSSEELMLLPFPSLAVMVVVPLQLSTFDKTGAAGV